MRSMSAPVRPASPSAASAALVASCDVVSPGAAIRRWRMPVRCWIHSSDVSTILASSALVSTLSGRKAPTPRTTERSLEMVMGSAILSLTPLGIDLKGWRKMGARLIRLCNHFPNLTKQLVPHHVIADLDRPGEPLRVGPAVALDDDAV